MMTETLIIALFIFFWFFLFLYFVPVNLWITAQFSGIQINLSELVFMRIRKAPIAKIVNNLIILTKAGIAIELNALETHHLASGDIDKLTAALVKVKSLDLPIETKVLAAQDLAGNDLMKYIDQFKVGKDSGIHEIKQSICNKIWEKLTDDQVRDVEKYISAF